MSPLDNLVIWFAYDIAGLIANLPFYDRYYDYGWLKDDGYFRHLAVGH